MIANPDPFPKPILQTLVDAGLAGLCLMLGLALPRAWAEPPDADVEVELQPLVVSGSVFASTPLDGVRSVSVITRKQIEASPAATLAELLDQVAGVDVLRRGGPGVQADIGIRGTAFEQTLVLINGVPLRDPQTGHHSLNLPLPLALIERIEIVKGPGGLAWAGLTSGGAINIITRSSGPNQRGLRLRGGRHDYREGGAWWFGGDAQGSQSIAAEIQRSAGHIDDEPTDFELARAYAGGSRSLGGLALRWGLGYERRKFGAWQFYTADFPDQREQTRSRLASLGAEHQAGAWTLDGRLWWRGHDDWFRTRVGDRDFINSHRTSAAGAAFSAVRGAADRQTGFGLRLGREDIDSNALGERRRDEIGVWAGHRRSFGRGLTLEGGVAVFDFEEDGTRWLPNLAVNWRVAPQLSLFAGLGRSSRPASWTEQRLVSRGNLGNPSLTAEDGWQAELGLRWHGRRHQLHAALFERRTEDLIDWGRTPGTVQWQADRFDGHRSRGAEAEWQWRPLDRAWLEALQLNYTWLDTRLDDRGLEIKYALDHARHAVNAAVRLRPSERIRISATLRHTERRRSRRTNNLDLRLSWQPGRMQLFIEAANLLDERDPEAGFAPQPGRWWFVGAELGF